MTVWRIAIDENGGNAFYNELRNRNVVAIGWPQLGTFSHLIGQPRLAIEQHAQNIGDTVYAPTPADPVHWWFGTPPGHPNPYGGHRRYVGRIFDYFINQIAPGDLVLGHVGKPAVGIAEICNTSNYFYDPAFAYAHCWGPVRWVDISVAGIHVSDCRFLGICKLGDIESKQVIQDWNNYIVQSGFNPC